MSDFDDDDLFEPIEPVQSAPKVPLSQRAMGLAAPRPAPYLDGLNPAQREAVEALDGPVLMLAGAGTGKTKALTTRIAHLLNTGQARPNEILSVTFTNKAAREMKSRVANLLGQTVEGMPWMGTFHSICVKLLRRHAELVGLKSNFTILDTDDQNRLLKQLIVAANIDEKRWPARLLSGVIDNWKNRAWTPAQVPTGDASAFNGQGVDLYHQYQERLKTLNACDFGDLLLHMVTIFQRHDDILKQYQTWFRYILVDEYQDTNVAQYLWLRLLAAGHKNICCVGDDDQSIYGWRGAEVGNILRFEADFPGAKVVKLEQNYRSTAHILGAAAGVIRGNEGRLGKELWTDAEGGDKLRLIGHWDGNEEARWVGEELEAMQRGTRGNDPLSLDDMAILVRASHQMRAFEDRFLTIGLPYRVIGGPRFYERLEIRDAMAYFRLAVSQDDDLAFERIVNTPRRGLGDVALRKIRDLSNQNGVSLVEGARIAVEQGEIKGKGGKGLCELVGGLDRWHFFVVNVGSQVAIHDCEVTISELDQKTNELFVQAELLQSDSYDGELSEEDRKAQIEMCEDAVKQCQSRIELLQRDIKVLNGDHVLLAECLLDESGYTTHWMNDKTPEAPGRLENLKELVKALEGFENLQGFLEHVSLIMDNESESSEEKVTIMTLHAAKGLEYPAVFLPGWEDGLFPSQRSMDESGLKGLEEERRLAYVGITRAEKICTISFAANRLVYGQWQSQLPSRFVDELPEEHVDVLTPPGLYGGNYGAAGGVSGVGSKIEEQALRADAYNSPGWKRMQENTGGRLRAKSSPSETRGLVIDMAAVSSFTQGNRVFHQKFGYGTVMGIEGDKLDIEFDKAGAKKVISKFIVLASEAGDVPF
ncbi:ATP-dependent helicase [Aliiroseovarius lamellibrachiae]|uniref:ATP-dependent helicase n=1 Tax=Aliiroseovarius lamellibrachiae TaxID=1924933 RepID=UPI001BE0058A|nr:UvrD-helicase domain-containing protein [Aliiroseovarius lamellibrachiae]MBT2130868.1 UvrD-helicase domain-containing protein [Aliiroseovarius lamellibrachiae]